MKIKKYLQNKRAYFTYNNIADKPCFNCYLTNKKIVDCNSCTSWGSNNSKYIGYFNTTIFLKDIYIRVLNDKVKTK